MDESKRRDRQMLEQFCLKNSLVGDFDFCSYDWEKFLKPKLQEFLTSIKSEDDPEKFRYRCPIRYISNDTKDESLWNEYWAVAGHEDEMINYIRNSICGIGSRKVKQQLSRKPTIDCQIIRCIFEVEDVMISSRKYFGYYLKKNIERRDKFLKELSFLSQEFHEKISLKKINQLIICDVNIFGEKNQFCWTIDDGETLPFIIDGNPLLTNISIVAEPKISRIEKLLERAIR